MSSDLKRDMGIIGGLSEPSKMPGFGWSIPALACKTGARLAKRTGTSCQGCYARKGRYTFPTVRQAMARRLAAWQAAKKSKQIGAWVDAFARVLKAVDSSGYFRWFDSGDIQDLDMLSAIADIARALPDRRFWLPTQEHALVLRWVERGGQIPPNLTIRLSSREVDGPRPAISDLLSLPSSSVTRDASRVTCPSKSQGNKCLTCRACWDPTVKEVVYGWH